MADIKDLSQEMFKRGMPQFMLCPECKSEEAAFAPVVIQGRAGTLPFVAALVCVSDACNGKTQIDIVNGYIQGVAT